MKKVILLSFFLLSFGFVKADNSEPNLIVTPCGTVHPVPAGASVDLILRLLDYWTKIDCKE